jgi:hypothetical protein
MSNARIMPWMDLLPGVTKTDLLDRRDSIHDLAKQAAEAELQAREFSRKAGQLREQASREACALEGVAKGRFSVCEVERAKSLAYSV